MHVSKSLETAQRATRAGKSRGFTLIELMVAMVVSGIVLLGIFAFSSIQQSNAVIHRRHVRIQQALEGLNRETGLWLDVDATLRRDGPAAMKTFQLGLNSQEHGAFRSRLTVDP